MIKPVTALLLLALTIGCKSIEYRDREPSEALKQGCQIPKAKASEVTRDAFVYIEDLKFAMCDCDSRMREFTGEPISERMNKVCSGQSSE